MRLIDADALNKKLCETTIFIKDGELFQRMINDAPTIEPDGDTISRSRAIKDVSEWATDILHPDRLIKEDAIYILESLPSAETPTVSEKHQLSEETPTNTPTDLISRQDAINAVENTDCELTTKDWEELTGALKSLPSAEQVTGKLKKPDDSLLTEDSDTCKESKSKLDLISRQAVLDAINGTFWSGIERAINNIPPATVSIIYCTMSNRACPFQGKEIAWCMACPHISEEDRELVKKAVAEPKTGEWEWDDKGFFRCDQCGNKPNDQTRVTDFCPNCGADMRKEESEDDVPF